MAYGDGTHGARIATVDARLPVQDLAPHDLRFQREADFLDRVGRGSSFATDTDFGKYARPDVVDRLGPGLLFLDRERRAQFALREFGDTLHQHLIPGRRRPIAHRGVNFVGELINKVDYRLHLLVAKHHRAEHHILGQFVRLRFDHQHGGLRPGDDEIQLRRFELGRCRDEHVLSAEVADASSADRAVERKTGNCERRRGADHRRNIGIDFIVRRQHCRNDLHFVVEAVRKQRANRAVDETARQNFFFRRTAFAFEKPAGYFAGSISAFLVINRKRQKILSCRRGLRADDSDQHYRVLQVHQHGTTGLARDFAGL